MSKDKEDLLPIFEKEARYWLNYFGLLDWCVTFESEPLEDTIAETRLQFVAKRAMLVLDSNYTEEADIKQTAFHEVCEILLGGLYHQAERSCVSDYQKDMIAMAGHDIIRRLENTIYRDLRGT